jgi:hypothetical protein
MEKLFSHISFSFFHIKLNYNKTSFSALIFGTCLCHMFRERPEFSY